MSAAYWRFQAQRILARNGGNILLTMEKYHRRQRGKSLLASLLIGTLIGIACFYSLDWSLWLSILIGFTVVVIASLLWGHLIMPNSYSMATALEELAAARQWLQQQQQAAAAAATTTTNPPERHAQPVWAAA